MKQFDLLNDKPETAKKSLNSKKAAKLAVYNAGLTPSIDPLAVFQQSKFNLTSTGEDPISDDVIEKFSEEYKVVKENAIKNVALDFQLSQEEKVDKAVQFATTPVMINQEEEYLIENADKAQLPYNDITEIVRSDQEALQIARDKMESIRKARGERSWLSATGDFFLSAAPFSQNEVLLDVAEVLLPEFVTNENGSLFYSSVEDMDSVGYLTSPGDITALLRRKYMSLPSNEKRDFVQKLVDTVEDNAGYTDDSLFTQEYVLGTVMQPFLDGEIDPESQSGWEIFDNVIFGLDLVAAGATVKSISGGAARMLDSPMAAMANSNPKEASKIAQEALKNDEIANAMGMSKNDLLETMLPQAVDPAGVLNAGLGSNARLGQDIIDLSRDTAFAYDKNEITNGGVKMLQSLAKGSEATLAQSASVINQVGNDLVAKARYVDANGEPFKAYKEAQEVGKKMFQDTDFEIMAWNRSTNAVEPINPLKPNQYYVIEHNTTRPIDNYSMKYDNLSFNDKDSYRNLLGYWNPFVAPSGRFDKQYMARIWQGLRKNSLISSKFTEMMRPFTNLKRNMIKEGIVDPRRIKAARTRITNLWKEGSDKKHVFTVGELAEKGLSHAEMRGYYSGIQLGNTQYVINNEKLYRRLFDEGYQTIENSAGGFMNVAKPYKESDGVVRTVYDAAEDAIVPFEKGMNVATLKGKINKGIERTHFIKLDEGTVLKPLTKTPLKHNEGYIPRYYDNLYFISVADKTIIHNGTEIPINAKNIEDYGSVIHGVDSIAEANRIIAKLQSENPDKIFHKMLDRDTFNDVQGLRYSEEEYMLNTAKGNMFFKGRGSKLGSDKFPSLNADAREVDPVSSIINSINTVSQKASMEDLTNSMISRWISDFGETFKLREFPENIDMIRSRNPELKNELNRARAYWRHINNLRGYGGMFATQWRRLMLGMGEWMDGKGLHGISAGVQRAGKKDPAARLRGIAFNTMIAGNPLRQAAIQTLQFIQLAGFDPKFVVAGLPQSVAFRKALYAKYSGIDGLYKASLKQGAKLFNTSEKEFEKLLKTFEDSGLIAEIDAHTMSRQSARNFGEYAQADTTLGKAYVKSRQAVAAPFMVGRKVGFEWGEQNVRIMTWLMARRQWARKNPGKAIDEDAVNNLTEALVFSMNRGDKMVYQDGLAGLVMQFISVQNKTLMNMLPEAIGGSKFTTGYKTRLALGNALMYGSAGLGLGELAGWMMDHYQLPETARDAIESGLMEYVVNTTLDTDLDISSSLAAAGGMYESFTKFVINIMTGEKAIWEIPPAAHTLNRFNDIYKTFHASMKNGSELTSDEVGLIIDSTMKLASGYKNFFLSQQMTKFQQFVDKYGSPIQIDKVAEKSDAIAKMFGIQSNKIDRHWDAIKTGKEIEQGYKDEAKMMFEHWSKLAIAKDSDVLTEIASGWRGMIEGRDPGEVVAFNREVNSLLQFDFKNKGDNSLLGIVFKQYMRGASGKTWEHQINKLVSQGEITKEMGSILLNQMPQRPRTDREVK